MTIKQLGASSAFYAQRIRDQVLIATYEGHDRDVRQEAMRDVWTIWPKLCRSMSALEALCPNTSEAGAEIDADQLAKIEAFHGRN